jgi:hypothetical protein
MGGWPDMSLARKGHDGVDVLVSPAAGDSDVQAQCAMCCQLPYYLDGQRCLAVTLLSFSLTGSPRSGCLQHAESRHLEQMTSYK